MKGRSEKCRTQKVDVLMNGAARFLHDRDATDDSGVSSNSAPRPRISASWENGFGTFGWGRGERSKRNMPFYQTNPPFSGRIFDVNYHEYDCCIGNERKISVGSFWKTNPPEGDFWGVFMEKWVRFIRTEPDRNSSENGMSLFDLDLGEFVLENEPAGGGFLGRLHGKVGSFHKNGDRSQ